MTKSGRVFVSYRRADSSHLAGRLADRLVEHFEVFMDMDTIDPGTDFTAVIREAVDGCDVLIAVIGRKWTSLVDATGARRIDDPDDWVVGEIATALQRDVPVIPVLVDGAVMPGRAELPPVLASLSSRQAVPVRHETFSTDVGRLISAVQRRLDATTPAAEPVTVPTTAEEAISPPVAPPPVAPPPVVPPPVVPPTVTAARPTGGAPPQIAYLAPARRTSPLPWVLAIVGVLLVAVVVAVLILRADAPRTAGRGEVSTVPVSAPPTTSVTGIRAHIPGAIRPSCRAYTPPDSGGLSQGVVEAVRCPLEAASSPANVWYLQYSDNASMERAFKAYATGDFSKGNCTKDRQQLSYQTHESDAELAGGTLRCYSGADKKVNFAWTHQDLHILAFAQDSQLDFTAMKDWWRRAGPYRSI